MHYNTYRVLRGKIRHVPTDTPLVCIKRKGWEVRQWGAAPLITHFCSHIHSSPCRSTLPNLDHHALHYLVPSTTLLSN